MEDLPFTVEEWDAEGLHRMETLARAANPVIARAAFHAAAVMRPNAHLLLRHGIRVVEEHRPRKPGSGQAAH